MRWSWSRLCSSTSANFFLISTRSPRRISTLWPFTATNTSPLYLSLSLNSRTETSSSPAWAGVSAAWAGATCSGAVSFFVFASLMVSTSRSQELKVEQVSMRIIYCSTNRSATFVAFQPAVALWFKGSAVPEEPSCFTMCCKPPPLTSVTP